MPLPDWYILPDVIIFYKVRMTKDDKSATDGLQDAHDRERFQMRIQLYEFIFIKYFKNKL